MPYKFEFRLNNAVRYSATLLCAQCEGVNGTGQRCKRQVCLNRPYCPQHARSLLGLEVRPSTIPGAGDGLFTLLTIPANDWIAPLLGETITEAQANVRYGNHTGPYLNTVPDLEDDSGAIVIDAILDSARVRGIGNAANTILGANGRSNLAACNCRIFANADDGGMPWLSSLGNPIPAGSELFAYYGSDFTLDPEVQHRTWYAK